MGNRKIVGELQVVLVVHQVHATGNIFTLRSFHYTRRIVVSEINAVTHVIVATTEKDTDVVVRWMFAMAAINQ